MTIKKNDVELLLDTDYLKIYDLHYKNIGHYYEASRHSLKNLAVLKQDEDMRNLLPDAVSCILILEDKDKESKLLLMEEFRYPIGRFVLSIPSGLCEITDGPGLDGLYAATVREINEETGLTIEDTDTLQIVTPPLFSTPGLSDESTAFVCAVLRNKRDQEITFSNTTGMELFKRVRLITETEAQKILQQSYGTGGECISIATWVALLYFAAGMWREILSDSIG